MIDVNELRELAQRVTGWSNCNAAWLDNSEDVPSAVVGHIDDDGSEYPIAIIDCEQYYSGDSLALAKFYAAANPSVILELIDRLDTAERDAKRYRVLRDSKYQLYEDDICVSDSFFTQYFSEELDAEVDKLEARYEREMK